MPVGPSPMLWLINRRSWTVWVFMIARSVASVESTLFSESLRHSACGFVQNSSFQARLTKLHEYARIAITYVRRTGNNTPGQCSAWMAGACWKQARVLENGEPALQYLMN